MERFSLEDADHEDEHPKAETKFWRNLIKGTLKPVPQKFLHNTDVQKSLEGLHNSMLALLLLVNLMWIVLLTSLNSIPFMIVLCFPVVSLGKSTLCT